VDHKEEQSVRLWRFGKKESIKEKEGIGKGTAKRYRLVVLLLILFLLASAGFLFVRSRRNHMPERMEAPLVETAAAERMDLANSVSVTGTIVTAEGKTQTTALSGLKAVNVYVEAGDEVQEGDVICTFDSSDIEEALAAARNNYSINQQMDALGNDYTAQYNESVEQAEHTLQSVRDKRDEAKSALETAAEGEDTAKAASEAAAKEQESKQAQYEEARAAAQASAEAYEALRGSGIVISDLDAYLKNLVNPAFTEEEAEAKAAYEALEADAAAYKEAKTAFEEAEARSAQTREAYERAKETAAQAYNTYEQAQKAREDAQEVYEESLDKAQETYERARLNAQLITDSDEKRKIEEYEEQLEDCTVRAAMTGVVTALYVEEGETFAGGTICEIQDMNHFMVEASVDEYDIVDISKGMTAYVKTDSMGDEEMEAEVTYVAPVGTTGSQLGSAGGTASYEIQITLKEPQERLRPGMTARVSISLEESRDALAVPCDCVQTNEKGERIVYIDSSGEKKEVVVETGIETDYYVEIISDEIVEGTIVYLSTPLLSGGASSADGGSEEENSMSFGIGGMEHGGMDGGMPSGGPSGGGPSGGPGGF